MSIKTSCWTLIRTMAIVILGQAYVWSVWLLIHVLQYCYWVKQIFWQGILDVEALQKWSVFWKYTPFLEPFYIPFYIQESKRKHFLQELTTIWKREKEEKCRVASLEVYLFILTGEIFKNCPRITFRDHQYKEHCIQEM